MNKEKEGRCEKCTKRKRGEVRDKKRKRGDLRKEHRVSGGR